MFARRLGNRARELLRVAARCKYATIRLRSSLLPLLYHPPLVLLLLLAPLLPPLFSSRFHLVFQSHHGMSSSSSLLLPLRSLSRFLFSLRALLPPRPFFPLPPRTNASAFLSVSFFRSLSLPLPFPARICLSSSLLAFSFSFLLSLSCSLAFSLPRTSRAMNSRGRVYHR